MNKVFVPFFVVLAITLVIVSQTFFTVDQRQQAIILQFGEPIGETKGPGLHFKIPLIQSVRTFDHRILSVDPPPDQVVISSKNVDNIKQGEDESETESFSLNDVTGEPIVLDTFARYKIVDALQFMKTLRTISGANSKLESILQNATRSALGKTSLRQLLSPQRGRVMNDIQEQVNATVKKDKLGIEIVDVRIVRADLTPQLRQSTVTRMKSELKERATETRAKGEEQALKIRSTAEKERTVLLAEARRDAEVLKGQGDKEAIKTYAAAFNKDKDFYAFIRSMEAYSNTLSDQNTRLILSPDSDFLRYFKDK